ncbi:MAG TPA: energy-coupling factor ABC transporter permease [Casimicrobiaceae bacterium]|nr:energy-coupling factor ABC transporter permease [Casimicrobiaceae bacterium]
MDLTAVSLSPAWIMAGWVAGIPVLLWALRTAPWTRLAGGGLVHVFGGAIVCEIVLWTIKATISDAFTFHLLGVTGFTLAVGPQLALIGSAIAVPLQIAVHGGNWENAGIGFVTMAAIPVAVAWTVHVLAQRRLPPNFFVYIFVGAFFGAAAALGAGGLAAACALAFGAGLPANLVFDEYVPYLLFLAWGEAMLTGMVVTLLVVYRPQWIVTFDDARYLKGR